MPSTSFAGSIASIAFASVICGGQRQLDEDPVDRVVGVQLGEQRQELLLGRVRGQADVARVDPDRLRRLLLAADVDVRRRVVADEHGGEADVPELGDLGRHFLAHLGRQRLAVDDGRGHRR